MNQFTYTHEGKRVAVPLEDRPVTFGRGDKADHMLPDKNASRIHAQAIQRQGRWCIEDLESANGTLVNGKKISGITPLNPGDRVQFGLIELTFEGDPPKEPETPDEKLARIVYQPDANKPATTIIIRNRITVGRKPENNLQIELKAVSSTHCEIIRDKQGYLLRDLDSSNGTMIGSETIKERRLNNGDIILLGKTAKLYFIDPLGAPSTQAPPPPPPQPPAQPEPQPAQPAPVRRVPGTAPENLAATALLNVGSALAIMAILCVGGWFAGQSLRKNYVSQAEENKPKPLEVQTDKELSFEGEIDSNGNPAGWLAAYEAPPNTGNQLDLASDRENPADGDACLRLTQKGTAQGLCVLTLNRPRPIQQAQRLLFKLLLRGEDISAVTIGVAVKGDAGLSTLAVESIPTLSGTTWSEITLQGTPARVLPANATFVLLINGGFKRLWLDRLTILPSPEPQLPAGAGSAKAGKVGMAIMPEQPGLVQLTAPGGTVSVQARIADGAGAQVSDDEFLTLASAVDAKAVYKCALPTRGVAVSLHVGADVQAHPYEQLTGLLLKYELRGDSRNAALVLNLRVPAAPGMKVAVTDRLGSILPMDVSGNLRHAYPYATISELWFEPLNLSLNFPRGTVAWFEQEKDALRITLRPAAAKRTELAFSIFERSVSTSRLHQRVLLEAEAYEKDSQFSAAQARYDWLLKHLAEDSTLRRTAETRVEALRKRRDKLRKDIDAAVVAAELSGTLGTIDEADRLIVQLLQEYPGDPDVARMNDKRKSLNELRSRAKPKRTPEDQAVAETVSEQYLAAAKLKQGEGDLLFALLMLDNILREYSDMPVYKEAKDLYDQIQKSLSNPEIYNPVIDAELATIDKLCDEANWAGAMERCNNLFKRFPETPRTRDIMKRVRRIENQG